MAVDLQADVLIGETDPVEKFGVLLRCAHRVRVSERIGTHVLQKWGFGCHLEGDGMGRVVGIGRDLNGKLTSGAQARGQLTHQSRMIGNPVQAGVGENNVEAALGAEAADIAQLEPQTVPGKGMGLGQHRLRRIDPDRCSSLGVRVEPGSQLSGAAPQIDHVATWNRLDHREEIDERLGTFGGEFRVLVGIPPLGAHRLVRHRHTSRHRERTPLAQARILTVRFATNAAGISAEQVGAGPDHIVKVMKRSRSAPPGEVVLEGFVLRRYQRDDAPALAVAVGESLEHLRPWMPWIALEPTTLEEREELLKRWDRDWAEGTQYSYGMFEGARVVGGAGLMRRIGKDALEIGYWVHPAFIGRGFATRAAGALTTLGLSLPGVTRVEIHHDKANVASGRVPLKLGFEMVAEQPDKISAPGETGLSCVWRMDRASWAARATRHVSA